MLPNDGILRFLSFLLHYATFISVLRELKLFSEKSTSMQGTAATFKKIMIQATPQIIDDMDCYLPDKVTTQKMARFFALFSDASRLRLLSALSISPLCVSDISDILSMNQTTVSHQLRILKDMDVVKCERDGKILKYSISNPKINEILLVGVEYLGF